MVEDVQHLICFRVVPLRLQPELQGIGDIASPSTHLKYDCTSREDRAICLSIRQGIEGPACSNACISCSVLQSLCVLVTSVKPFMDASIALLLKRLVGCAWPMLNWKDNMGTR